MIYSGFYSEHTSLDVIIPLHNMPKYQFFVLPVTITSLYILQQCTCFCFEHTSRPCKRFSLLLWLEKGNIWIQWKMGNGALTWCSPLYKTTSYQRPYFTVILCLLFLYKDLVVHYRLTARVNNVYSDIWYTCTHACSMQNSLAFSWGTDYFLY